MSDAERPPSEGSDADQRLWVVDVVAPLPPGRVRLVAADAAARLNLPAEKLVSLLENRIGPVTKPLPRASADRVAEVLDVAGAEVEVRSARASDGPPSAARARAAQATPSPGSGARPSHPLRRASDVPQEHAEEAEAPREPAPAPQSEPEPQSPSPFSPAASPDAAPPVVRDEDGGSAPSTTRAGSALGATPDEDDAVDRGVDGGGATPSPSGAGMDASGAAPARPAGGVGPASRTPDPWSAMDSDRSGSDDEAMLGTWRGGAGRGGTGHGGTAHRGTAHGGTAREASGPGPAGPGGDTAGASPGGAGAFGDRWGRGTGDTSSGERAERAARSEGAPAARSPSPGRSTGATRPAWEDEASGPDTAGAEPAGDPASAAGVRVTPVDGGRTPNGRTPGARGVEVRVPRRDPPVYEPDEDDEDDEDDEPLGYAMRDPFAEAERRDRVVRRTVLAGVLVAAVVLLLVLQWAYSRPGAAGAEPPAYAVGLQHYREGAFVGAARAWMPRAEAGDAQAMYMLGYMAEIGQGRPWSNREAAGWYRQAAERGHAEAQLRLAALHRSGMGVVQDDAAALAWTLRAAEARHPRAQLEAARLLALQGRPGEAAAWLRSAAERDPEAAAWWSVARAVQDLKDASE